jgi:hypothetical protein
LVVSLRAAIDHASASLLDDGSNSSDLARLVNAVEYLTKLLPERQLAAPESQRDDPREVLWQMLKEGRERAALGFEGYDGKVRQVKALQDEVATLKAEIAALKAGSAPAPPDVPMLVESVPAPAAVRVVQLSNQL